MKENQTEESRFENEEYKRDLLALARAVVAEKSIKYVEECLDEDKIRNARITILGALDYLAMHNEIDYEKAKQGYELLGFSKEEAIRFRQENIKE